MKNLKQITLAAALILGCATLANAKSVKNGDVVWADVTHGYTTTDEFTFRRVTLTDTATIVAFDFDYPAGRKFMFPKSTHLVTDGGQQLKLLRMEGADFGQWLTTDGTTQHYVMHFEPAPKATRWLHYIETGKPGDWNIGYIRDKSRKMAADLPAEWRKVKYDRRTPLPAVRYAPDSAFIRVHVVNYDPSIGIQIYHSDDAFKKQVREGMTIVTPDEKGEALIRVKIPFATVIRLYFGRYGGSREVLLQPGETAELLVDMSGEKSQILHCKGVSATLNYEVVQPECVELVKVFAAHENLERLGQCPSAETRLVCADSLLAAGTSAINRSPWSEATKAFQRMRLEYGYSETLRDFASTMGQLYRLQHPEVPMNQARWDSLKTVYRDCLPPDVAERYLAGKPLELNWSPSAAILGRRFFTLAAKDTKDANGVTNQLNYELRRAYQCMQEVNYADSVLATIHDSGIRQLLDKLHAEEDSLLAEIKSRKNVFFHELDSVAPERILAEIIGRYKGRVVLVDVWESWCGPCRRGHEQMVPVKKELADRNIRYVYLSSPSSDPAMWNKLIADIEGDHYFLTDEQMRAVANELQSNAVPTYAIYDAEGILIYKQRGVDTKSLKAQLLKATE